ncbi:MAG TPA: hypothetical protein VKR05_06130 [Candidatus Cybelea sp.]|nr:hypothetical protein [Candidatus Cybelea sp.]
MVDYKSIATSIADGLNGIQRAMKAIPVSKTSPEFERWQREMTEASKHVLMAFGIDPDQLKSPAFPCGGGWFVEWKDGENGEWRAVERT